MKGFLHSLVLKLGQKSVLAKSSTTNVPSSFDVTSTGIAIDNGKKQPTSYADALCKKKSVAISKPPSSKPYSVSTKELVTPRRRVFQRQASCSSLVGIMAMTPIELDRSHNVDVDTSPDAIHDYISHDVKLGDYTPSNDNDLAIERHRFLKSFNRNKYARGASKGKVDDFDIPYEDSFHYDGKVLDFGTSN